MNSFLLAVFVGFWGLQGLLAQEPAESIPQGTLSWDQAFLLAVENNPEIQIAQNELKNVEGRILVARANFLPKLSAQAVTLPPTIVFTLSQTVFSRAMAPTFRSFPVARAVARANAELSVIEMSYRLRTAYAAAYFAQELVGIVEQGAVLYRERIRRAPELFEAGLMTKSNQKALEVRAALAEERLERARSQQLIARLQMNQIIGLPAGDSHLKGLLTPSFELVNLPAQTPEVLIEKAMQARLDLKIFRGLKEIGQEQVRIVSAAGFPVLGVGTTLYKDFATPREIRFLTRLLNPQSSQQDQDNQDITGGRSTFAAQASWRLVDWGAVQGQVDAAQAGVIKQEIALEQLEREIPRQVRLAYSLALSAQNLSDELDKSDYARANLKAAQQTNAAGTISQNEVLNAQEEFINNEEYKLELRYNRDLALAALDRSLGQSLQSQITLP